MSIQVIVLPIIMLVALCVGMTCLVLGLMKMKVYYRKSYERAVLARLTKGREAWAIEVLQKAQENSDSSDHSSEPKEEAGCCYWRDGILWHRWSCGCGATAVHSCERHPNADHQESKD
jgi:hypothetical protein